ncbi:hypothetical protein [Burkholderia phage FLC9]|nr:hypothetical protein [Burkholderia phage FLC9]
MSALSDALAAASTAIGQVATKIKSFQTATDSDESALQNQITTLSNTVSNIALVRGLFNALTVNTTGKDQSVSVQALEMVLKDGSGHVVVLSNVNVVAACSNQGIVGSGLNSLDTGTFQPNTWYSVWVVYNPSVGAGAILSASATAPTLPSGYTFYTRVGWIRTDSTTNCRPLAMQQKGAEVRYKVTASSNVTALPILASGAAGDTTIPTWVAIPWTAFAPPTTVDLKLLTGSNGGSCTVMVAPNNNFGAWNSIANLPPIMHSNVGSYLFTDDDIAVESNNIYWASNAGAQPPTPGTSGNSGILCVMGWTDNI